MKDRTGYKASGSVRYSRGFTLVEMAVIAPIVVLLIGAFIALIVNLTGNVMSARGKNVLVYDTQDALSRIEDDVKLSSTFLAVNNIDLSSTKQGYRDYPSTGTTGSTTNFTNVSSTSSASIILNMFVTDNNPLYGTSNVIYLANQPNACTTAAEYSKNTPMTANVVYFVDNGTLWRRVLMPATYATASTYCGSKAPWQLPTCANGYIASQRPFCKSSDEALLSDIDTNGFTFQYYSSASSTTPDATAVNTASSNATRDSALQADTTIEVTLSTRKTIAGDDISHSASIRATRLDANASTINN